MQGAFSRSGTVGLQTDGLQTSGKRTRRLVSDSVSRLNLTLVFTRRESVAGQCYSAITRWTNPTLRASARSTFSVFGLDVPLACLSAVVPLGLGPASRRVLRRRLTHQRCARAPTKMPACRLSKCKDLYVLHGVSAPPGHGGGNQGGEPRNRWDGTPRASADLPQTSRSFKRPAVYAVEPSLAFPVCALAPPARRADDIEAPCAESGPSPMRDFPISQYPAVDLKSPSKTKKEDFFPRPCCACAGGPQFRPRPALAAGRACRRDHGLDAPAIAASL